MKRFSSCFILMILVLAAVTPGFSQKNRIGRTLTPSTQADVVNTVDAVTDGRGVLVRWQNAENTAHIGYTIFRTDAGGTIKVNEELIPGAFGRTGTIKSPIEDFEYYDREGTAGSVYSVHSLGTQGETATYAAVQVRGATRSDIELIEKAINRTPNASVEGRGLDISPELRQTMESSVLPPDINTHRWVVSQPGAKIGVRREGIFRVTRAQLEAVGFNVNSSSANWRLFMQGIEQAIIVGGNGDYIEFYGKPVDTVESDMRIYYLIADAVEGRRMVPKLLNNFGGPVISPNSFVTAEKKERSSYISAIQNGDLGNYWGRIVTNSPTAIPFTLTGLDTTVENVYVNVKMQGYSPTAHTINITINGNSVGAFNGNNRDIYQSGEILVPRAWLNEGSNTLTLSTILSNDYSLFDSVSVRYKRKWVADSNKLIFATPGYRKVNVGGFTTSNVRMFDITYDANPQPISNLNVENINGSFTAKLPSHRTALFYGMEDTAFLQPASVVANVPSTLSVPTNEADMIIISHSSQDFLNSAQAWANYRASGPGGNYQVKVVSIADIFDEFNYGVNSPTAINDFLSYANSAWNVAPHYVLMIGDGSYDPRNYQGFGYWDLIPTKMINLIYAESGSDEALADFDHDGKADVAIGRIPARTFPSINNSLNKTMLFESSGVNTLDRGAIFAFDMPIGFDFEAMSLMLRDELPPRTESIMVNRGLAGSQALLLSEINKGRYITNYAGHGSAGVWASTSFFGVSNVSSLTNANKPTIFTMLTCFNGYFLRPDADALVEPLMASANGGAVASWASTTETTPDIQLLLATRFYDRLGEGNISRLGDLVRDAKMAIPNGSDVGFSWALFGDPALKVR